MQTINKQQLLIKLRLVAYSLNKHDAATEHLKYIAYQLRHDLITPADAMEHINKLNIKL